MSEPAAQSVPAAPKPPGRRLLWAVLVMTPIVSIGISVLLVLSILHFLAQVPSSAVAKGLVGDPQLLRDIVKPFAQTGTISVKRISDVVYYPVPYASPPNLTLTSKSADRSYTIVRQDEFGFVWMVDVGLKDAKQLAETLQNLKDPSDLFGALTKPDGKALPKLQPGGEFTWEARGVRPFTTQAAMPPFQQTGTFQISPGGPHEQVEHFPQPFATPPNVIFFHHETLPNWGEPKIKILLTTPLGFRWQASNPNTNPARIVKMNWTARGTRATPEQIAEFNKNQPAFLQVVEDSGKFTFAYGEQGEAGFTKPFAFPPNVTLMPDVRFGAPVIVSEITTKGFKWKCPGAKREGTLGLTWTARGVPQDAVWKKIDKR
jgi:hypothetical protein